VQEKKGHFTLASGRNISSMRAPFENLPIASTPAVLLNGAGIYDYEHEKMLRFHAINPAGYELVCAVMKKFPTVEVEILTSNSAYAVNARIFANVMLWADDLPHRKFKKISEVPPDDWGKVIFLGMPPLIAAVKKYLLSIADPNVNFMSSSVSSFEMLEKGIHKGVGVMEIAKLYGIERAPGFPPAAGRHRKKCTKLQNSTRATAITVQWRICSNILCMIMRQTARADFAAHG